MSMDGNVEKQIEVLTQRSKNLANIVATSGIYRYQADAALRMIYMPAMCYSLPAVSISEPILDKIQNKALESVIPALGFNHGFPRAMVLGPKEFGGMGVPHLYTEMNVRKLEYLIMHIRHNSDLGKLFRINLNWMQINLGLSTPLFEYKHEITYITNWFTHLHKFLLRINAKLVIKDTYVPILEREFDAGVMETILSSSVVLSRRQLCHVHNWRLYFQVHKLSDLTTARGDRILPMYLNFPGGDNMSSGTTKTKWPNQDRPTCKASFLVWTLCIRHCFLQGRSITLTRSLGKWLIHPKASESTWPYYIHQTYESLICRNGERWQCYPRINRTTSCTTTFDSTHFEYTNTIPDYYIPVDVTSRDSFIVAHHSKQRLHIQNQIASWAPNYIIQSIHNAPKWKQHLIQHFHIPDPSSFSKLLQDINTRLIVVSDGGLSSGKGSFGVAFGTVSNDIGCIEGPAPGNSILMTSLRSEAYGVFAALAFLNLYVKTYSLSIPQNRRINLYSDNLGLIKWLEEILNRSCYPRMHLRAEADVLIQIHAEITEMLQSNFILNAEHVKGHQDDVVSYNELPREAQLNVKADSSATNYIRHGTTYNYEELTNNPVSLYVCDQLISRDHINQIRSSSRSPELRTYFILKYDMIWWHIHAKSINSFSQSDQRRIRKYIIGWLPTCARLNYYDKNVCPESPSCRAPLETQRHLLHCSCNSRLVIKNLCFHDLDLFLQNERYIPPMVRQLFFNHLASELYPAQTPPITLDYDDIPTQRAIADQQKIGWNQLLYGRFSILWGSLIGRHLSLNRVPEIEMTMDRWGKIVIKRLFQLMLDIWECRNREGHCLNERNESQLSRQRLLDKNQFMQESNPDLRSCKRDFVFCPMETLENYSLGNLESWYKSTCSILQVQHRYRKTQPSIRNSFPVLDVPPISEFRTATTTIPPDPAPFIVQLS